MKIALPDTQGRMADYTLTGAPIAQAILPLSPARIVYSAAHVVADPFTANDPSGRAAVDWDKTMAFRRYLAGLGLGIAEAMDTAQRGMGLDWPGALELIRRTKAELPEALVGNGCGTDHLDPSDAKTLDDVIRAYLEQVEAIQAVGGRIVLSACDQPVILHWLGEMFDPALAGYWGGSDFDATLETVLAVIEQNLARVDGIKMSLLDKDKEIALRRRLPAGVKMYTGDDFNYPELIEGDEQGFSHALLGIFDPLAPAAAFAVNRLAEGDKAGFRATLDPTVPLARTIFRAPTQYYKTGVVFLAWLNGFQDHFIMLSGHQAMRPLPYFTEVFRQSDACGLLRDPELAVRRMKSLLAVYGA